jgi:hypothetical protein
MVGGRNFIICFFPFNIVDDDFDAFYSIAHSKSLVNVRVTVARDAISSSGASKACSSLQFSANANSTYQVLSKKKIKTVSTANTSLEVSNNVAESEQIIMEEEDASSRATDRETDARKRKNSVVSPRGDNDSLEGANNPHKKRKKDESRSVAVSKASAYPVPSASSNVGPESKRAGESQVPQTNQMDGEKA